MKKYNKKKIISFTPIILIIAFCLLAIIIMVPNFYSKADPSIATADISATLFDTNEYVSGTQLTEDGGVVTGWTYATNKYLQIDPNVPNDGNKYKITVEMPKEFYAVVNGVDTPSGYESVNFIKNETFPININETYNIKPYSGKFEYMMAEGQTSGTIQLPIAFDDILWADVANESLTENGVIPLAVKLIRINNNGEESVVKNIKIRDAKAGDGREYPPQSMMYMNNVQISGLTLKADETMCCEPFYINVNHNTYTYFYKELNIRIKLPSYTDANNIAHYVKFDPEEIIYTQFSNPNYVIEDSNQQSEGIVDIKFTNVTLKNNRMLKLFFEFPEDLIDNTDTTEFLFNNGRVIMTANANNGVNNIEFYNRAINDFKYATKFDENVTASTASMSANINDRDENIVARLGGFNLKNEGTGDSCSKIIKYDFDTNNTGLIKVTTVNLPIPTGINQNNINIKYTLVDDENNKVFFNEHGDRVDEGADGAVEELEITIPNATSENFTRFIRSMLPENQKNYYFKSIEYTINTIPEGVWLYRNGGESDVRGGGNYWGYVDCNAANNSKAYTNLTISSEDDSIPTLRRTATTTIIHGDHTSYSVENVVLSANSIQAGQSLRLSGTTTVTIYPYTYGSWLKNIIIGLVLPDGVSINEQTVNLKYTVTGASIEGQVLIPVDLGNGNKLWKIKLANDAMISYYNENLGALSNGNRIEFSMQLDTSSMMNATVLSTYDMLYVAGLGQVNYAGGAYNWAKKLDIYDLNENGRTNDNVGGIQDSARKTCQIIPEVATLDITDNISIRSNGTILPSGDNNIYTNTDIVTYNVDIACQSGGTVDDFEYYIPIPKKTLNQDNFIVKSNTNSWFNFALQGQGTLTNSDIFALKYAFDTGLNYQNAKNIENWYSAEEIELESNLNWKDVTMIKVIMKNGRISNGDSGRISIDLKYDGESYVSEAGMQDIWSSGGFYHYINNGRVVSGDVASPGASVKLNCLIDLVDEAITLTAAKDRLPHGEGAVNRITVDDILPNLINQHVFTVTNIETYNVSMQTKNYMINNANMSSALANQTFAITLKMNNGNEYDSTIGTNIGTTVANSIPQFTYELYNADSLSDNLQTRYVIITLSSDMGIVIKQKININVEVAEATEVAPSIAPGKSYIASADSNSEITITQDSSFTAQFSMECIPNMYDNQIMMFSDSLPQDTTIVLVDIRDGENPTYWHYKITENEISQINLNQFNQMGTISGNKYLKSNSSVLENEKFLVIVDFGRCGEYLSNDRHSITLKYSGSNVEDFELTKLYFTTTNKRVFGLNISKPREMFETEFNINYSESVITGIETIYSGRKLSLVINAPNDLPNDSYIVTNSVKYYMNPFKKFIIPLDNIQDGNYSLSAKMVSNMLPKDTKDYTLNVELWASATANGSQPLLGKKLDEKSIIINNKQILQPALKVESLTKRLIKTSQIQEDNNIVFNYKKIDGCTVTLELQKKIGNGYQKVTNVLSQVNGITAHTMGVFALDPSNGQNNISFKLSIATEKGTYRLLFKVNDNQGNKLLEIPYNFIVIED